MRTNKENQQIVINGSYEIFILLLVVFSIINSIILFFPIQPEPRLVILIIDSGIGIFLLLDFFYRLLRARSKRFYFINSYGWLAFLGSLPYPWLRILRLLQMAIVWRKLRRYEFIEMGEVVIERRAQTALLLIILLMVMVLEVSGIWVLNAEANSPGANIKTASDALWWGLVTMATVGYGDRYPVTNPGRIAGVFEMTVGVGIFSVLTSFLANWFRTSRKMARREAMPLNKVEPVSQTARLQEVRRLIEEQESQYQQSIAELKNRLAEIERGLGTSDR